MLDLLAIATNGYMVTPQSGGSATEHDVDIEVEVVTIEDDVEEEVASG